MASKNTNDMHQPKHNPRQDKTSFQDLCDNTPVGIFTTDSQGHLLYANQELLHIIGAASMDEVNARVKNLAKDLYADAGRRDEMLKQLMQCGRIYGFEFEAMRLDGGRVWLSLSAQIRERREDGSFIIDGLATDITKRKQAEQALMDSEERYKYALEASKEGIWDWNIVTNDVLYNTSYLTMLGFGPGDLPLDENFWLNRIHPDDKEIVLRANNDVLDNKTDSFEAEFRMLTKDGRWRWIHGRGKAVSRDESGRATRMIGTHSDITSRKRVEENLRESERQLSTLMSNLPGIAYRCVNDEFWTMDFISDGCFDLTGYRPGDLVANKVMAFADLIHPEDRDMVAKHVRAALENNTKFEIEYRIIDANGTLKHVWEKGCGIYMGQKLQKVEGFITDITDRKLAERRLQAALDRISFHVENSPLAVIEWDKGTHIKSWSSRAEAIFGWTANEVLGKSWEDFDFIHPDDFGIVSQKVESLFKGRDVFNTVENRNLRKDGATVHCQWYNSALLDESGEMVSILSQVADVSELKQVLSELASAKELAEAANRAKSEFLANMSHELRTPLNGIMGMHQLLSTTPLDPEQRDYVDKAVQSAKRLTTLLGDIIDISKVEAGKMDVAAKPFDMHETLQLVRQLFLPSCEQKRLLLRFQVDSTIPNNLLGDNARLLQVLNNLVGNAVKFTDTGSVDVGAHPLPATSDGAYRVLFWVKDTGIGIEDGMLDSLFGAFTQADEGYRRKYQGAGLGLSIVKSLVHLMGGNLAVASEPGKGTSFYFSLPFNLDHSEIAGPARQEAGAKVNLASLTILLAEDEATNRMAQASILAKKGCRVQTAENGREVLEILKQERFDAILMDIQMPAMDGVEATRSIRNGQSGINPPDIPIVALTAYAMTGDREKFLAAGMDGYLSKPADLADLQEVLGRVLNKARHQG